MRAAEHAANVTSERLEGAGDAEGELAARTFLGFVDFGASATDHLVGCFALCVEDLRGCETSVDGATVEGAFVPPPRPTVAARALVAMVHHPSETFGSIGILSCLLAAIALATRKRPRAK